MRRETIGLLLAVVGLAFWFKWGINMGKKLAPETAVKSTVVINGSELVVKMRQNKLSLVDLKVMGISGLVLNRDIFNSELLNKMGDDGSWHIVAGVMKSTSELPEGDIVVGSITRVNGKEVEVVGKVTIPADGDGLPREETISTGEVGK